MPGRNNDNVRVFNSDTTHEFSSFPRNLERFFPNLEMIGILGPLRSISAEDLAPWPNLILLNLAENSITTLESDLFQNSPKLLYLSFANNSIQTVGVDLLSKLNYLTSADFRGNICIDTFAETPEEIENLKVQLITQCSKSAQFRGSVKVVIVASLMLFVILFVILG